MAHKATLYGFQDSADGLIYLSAFPSDSPEWALNHIVVGEVLNGRITKRSSALTVLRNVLADAEIKLVED